MSCPMQHEFPVGGLLPIFRRYLNLRESNILFHDYYTEFYKRFGITRDEMMCIMPTALSVDVLSACDKLEYIDEKQVKDKPSK